MIFFLSLSLEAIKTDMNLALFHSINCTSIRGVGMSLMQKNVCNYFMNY